MMTLTTALVVAAILSMMHPSTRSAGIICIVVLCILHPLPTTFVLLGIGGVYYFTKK